MIRDNFHAYRRGGSLLLLRHDAADVIGSWFDAAAPALLVERLGPPMRRFAGRGCSTLHEAGGRRFVVKRCRHGGLLRFFTGDRYLSVRRFIEELDLSLHVEAAGVLTPRLVAFCARRRRHGFLEAHLVSEELPGAVDLFEYLSGTRGGRSRREAIAEAGRAVRGFHDAGFYHADLNLRNVLVCPGEKTSRIALLDLAGARRFSPLPDKQRFENVARLNRSADKLAARTGLFVTPADRLRFLRAYLGSDNAARVRDLLRGPLRYSRAHRLLW